MKTFEQYLNESVSQTIKTTYSGKEVTSYKVDIDDKIFEVTLEGPDKVTVEPKENEIFNIKKQVKNISR